jgi:hypothetical protein
MRVAAMQMSMLNDFGITRELYDQTRDNCARR